MKSKERLPNKVLRLQTAGPQSTIGRQEANDGVKGGGKEWKGGCESESFETTGESKRITF